MDRSIFPFNPKLHGQTCSHAEKGSLHFTKTSWAYTVNSSGTIAASCLQPIVLNEMLQSLGSSCLRSWLPIIQALKDRDNIRHKAWTPVYNLLRRHVARDLGWAVVDFSLCLYMGWDTMVIYGPTAQRQQPCCRHAWGFVGYMDLIEFRVEILLTSSRLVL